MSKRVILAGVLGAVAMFLWTTIAHMVLPLGEAGIKMIDNEQALLSTMQSTLSQQGMYMFPNMPPGTSEDEYLTKMTNGPSGLLIYFPKRAFSFGTSMVVEFVVELLQAMIAIYLLSLTRVGSFAGRLGFVAVIGLVAAVATNISYWNWYGFPTAYTSAYMLTTWVGYVSAGLVAAGMKIGGAQQAA